MSSLLENGRRTWRTLAKRPGFTLAVVALLALGIGATCAIVAFVDSLSRPLPYEHPDRLVMIWGADREKGLERLRTSPPDLEDWSRQGRAFAAMAALYPLDFNLTGESGAERVSGAGVSSAFFRTLGVRPALGRDFARGEDSAAAPKVVLLSDGLWRSRYGADPRVIGRSIRVDGVPRTVAGIVPAGLELPRGARLWVPLTLDEMVQPRTRRFLEVLARLAPGVTVEAAQAEMDTIAGRLARQYPESNIGRTATVVPLLDELVGEIRPVLRVLAGAAGLVLLITCANVANLLLARGLSRGREIAVRQALGASRGQIVRQLLGEGLVLALLASLVGLALGFALLRLSLPLVPEELLQGRTIGVDGRVLGFTLLFGMATTLLFALVPALRFSRGDLPGALKEGGRWVAGGGGALRNAMVAAELTLAFVLLAGSLLLSRSLLHLLLLDPGFRPAQVLSVRVGLDAAKYEKPEQMAAFFSELVRRVGHLRGVEAAAAIDALPLTGSTEGTFYLPEGQPRPRAGEEPITRLSVVSEGAFQTLGIALLRGRDFAPGDDPGKPPVVIVNETLARRGWPGQDPVGKRMKLGFLDATTWYEVVGVARDVRYEGLSEPVLPRTYLYSRQVPTDAMTLVLRTAVRPESLTAAVRRTLAEMDPDLPIYDVRTLEELVRGAMANNRMAVFVVSAFAAVALLLSTLGLYGLVASSVATRAREFGIRIALGSRRAALLWLVLQKTLLLGLSGVAVGILLSALSGRALSGLLFGFRSGDPATFVLAGSILVAVALVGSGLPAWRAARTDPATALQDE